MCQNFTQIELLEACSKAHVVKTKHIEMRMDIDDEYGKPSGA